MRCTPLMGGLVYSCEVRYPLQVRQTSVPVTLQLMQSDTAAMLPQVMQHLYRAQLGSLYLFGTFCLSKASLSPGFFLESFERLRFLFLLLLKLQVCLVQLLALLFSFLQWLRLPSFFTNHVVNPSDGEQADFVQPAAR